MITYEEYTQRVENILQQMRESKIEEGKAKNRNKKLDEIHDLFVEQRNRLYAQHNKLINEWREQNGMIPRPHKESENRSVGVSDERTISNADGDVLPPPYVELPEERPNEIGG